MQALVAYKAFVRNNATLVHSLERLLHWFAWNPERFSGSEVAYEAFNSLIGCIGLWHESIVEDKPLTQETNLQFWIAAIEQVQTLVEIYGIGLERKGKLSRYAPLAGIELIKLALRAGMWTQSDRWLTAADSTPPDTATHQLQQLVSALLRLEEKYAGPKIPNQPLQSTGESSISGSSKPGMQPLPGQLPQGAHPALLPQHPQPGKPQEQSNYPMSRQRPPPWPPGASALPPPLLSVVRAPGAEHALGAMPGPSARQGATWPSLGSTAVRPVSSDVVAQVNNTGLHTHRFDIGGQNPNTVPHNPASRPGLFVTDTSWDLWGEGGNEPIPCTSARELQPSMHVLGGLRRGHRSVSAASTGQQWRWAAWLLEGGEIIHLTRPLLYVLLLLRHGPGAWRPWLSSLALDLCSLLLQQRGRQLLLTAAAQSSVSGGSEPTALRSVALLRSAVAHAAAPRGWSTADQHEALARKVQLVRYLLRSPCFNVATRPALVGVAGAVGWLPLMGSATRFMLNLVDGMQQYYTYVEAT